MRLFFAVMVPDDVLDRIQSAQADLRAVVGEQGVRWAPREQFHFTLKFLGECPTRRSRIAVATATAVRESNTPFEIAVGGLGAFPNRQRPSTLWTGTQEGDEPLTRLAGQLEELLHNQGFPHENRPLKPHLTLARIKGYEGELAASCALKSMEIGELGRFTVTRFALVQSNLKPSGSEYAVIEEFDLHQ